MKDICVTGGLDYIGSHLVDDLVGSIANAVLQKLANTPHEGLG